VELYFYSSVRCHDIVLNRIVKYRIYVFLHFSTQTSGGSSVGIVR
jgi:hypothetical protein